MTKPTNLLAIDLYCGLGGWAEALLDEGYRVVGFDNEQHVYGDHAYPAQLVLQDVRTLHGSQFKDASLIVASPPCQKYSYMAMPWTRAKRLQEWYRDPKHPERIVELNELFDACFRIQREASAAADHHIPLIVENVCGAQKWVGKAPYHYGSYYLWGDIPALMPRPCRKGVKIQGSTLRGTRPETSGDRPRTGAKWIPEGLKASGFRFDGRGDSFQSESVKNTGGSWFNVAHNTISGKGNNPDGRRTDPGKGARFTSRDCGAEGTKCGGDWFNGESPSDMRHHASKSSKRKAASAMIAKIPYRLARHIARYCR